MNLPQCFGHYMIHEKCRDHQNCRVGGYYHADEGYNCCAITNETLGKCDCEFKKSCHLGRQEYAFRPKENCDVWYYFTYGHWKEHKPVTVVCRKLPFYVGLFHRIRGWFWWVRHRLGWTDEIKF